MIRLGAPVSSYRLGHALLPLRHFADCMHNVKGELMQPGYKATSLL
jgi:hypothetical protein